MRTSIMLAASVLVLGLLAPASAFAGDKKNRTYNTSRYTEAQVQYEPRRPASVAQNGLCQRDTGTPNSSLNFRNECDMREFWARMNRQGGYR